MIPEVSEAVATAETAALYAEMRAAFGVPMVNLIYRHIATIPGGLAWVWGAVGPHVRSGEIEALAAALRDVAAGTAVLPPTEALSAEVRREIVKVARWYNRGNALNLVALLAFRQAAAAGSGGRAGRTLAAVASPPVEALPAPVPIERVEPVLRARIEAIADRQGLSAAGIVPTLYLHLAHWPGALAGILDAVGTAIEDGRLAGSVDIILRAARESASGLSGAMMLPAGSPPAEARAAIATAIDAFTATAIPQMLAVGTSLARS